MIVFFFICWSKKEMWLASFIYLENQLSEKIYIFSVIWELHVNNIAFIPVFTSPSILKQSTVKNIKIWEQKSFNFQIAWTLLLKINT